MDPVDLVREAALFVISDDLVAARATLKQINTERLEEERSEAYRRVRDRLAERGWVAPETRSQRGRNPGQS